MWDFLKQLSKSAAIQVVGVLLIAALGAYSMLDVESPQSTNNVQRSIASTPDDEITDWSDDSAPVAEQRFVEDFKFEGEEKSPEVTESKVVSVEGVEQTTAVKIGRDVTSESHRTSTSQSRSSSDFQRDVASVSTDECPAGDPNCNVELNYTTCPNPNNPECEPVCPSGDPRCPESPSEEPTCPDANNPDCPAVCPGDDPRCPSSGPPSVPVLDCPGDPGCPIEPTIVPDTPPIDDSHDSGIISGPVDVDLEVPTPDMVAGSYFVNPIVSLSASGANSIKYCLEKDVCCNDFELGSGTEIAFGNFVAPIDITSGGQENGNFCLSAQSSNAEGVSAIMEYWYFVNDLSGTEMTVLPDPVDPDPNDRIQLQTNEVDQYLAIQSQNAGKPNYTFFQLNMPVENAAATCAAMVSAYGPLDDTFGMRQPASVDDIWSTGSLTVSLNSPMVPADTILVSINNENNLNYGDNWLLSVLKYSTLDAGDNYVCEKRKVVLEDFAIFMVPFINGQYFVSAADSSQLQGGFESYGHFNSGSANGSGTSTQTGSVLEYGFINITN